MSAYFIFDNIAVHNQEAIDKYIREAPATVAAFGGKYRAIYGQTLVVEGDPNGDWKPKLPVIIEFPSFEQAKAWYFSDMYKPLKELRTGAQDSTGVLIEGLPPMPWFVKLFGRFMKPRY